MIWLCAALLAGAADPAAVRAAMDETATARTQRLAPRPPTISPEDLDRAAAGKIVTGLASLGGQGRTAWGITVMDAPIAEVWAAVRSYSDKTDMGGLSFSQVQEGASCQDNRVMFQYLPISVPFVSDRWWVTRVRHNDALAQATSGRVQEMMFAASADESAIVTDEARRMAAEATPISYSQGGWLLVDVGGATYLEYHVLSDPGGSLPAGLAQTFATGAVSDNLEAIAKIHRSGTGCPL
jgi:hypothetical protein